MRLLADGLPKVSGVQLSRAGHLLHNFWKLSPRFACFFGRLAFLNVGLGKEIVHFAKRGFAYAARRFTALGGAPLRA